MTHPWTGHGLIDLILIEMIYIVLDTPASKLLDPLIQRLFDDNVWFMLRHRQQGELRIASLYFVSV